MKYPALFLLSASLLVLSAPEGRAAEQLTTQSLTLPNLSAQISFVRTAEGQPMIIARFTTKDSDKNNVYCLSAYRDLQYVLRDSSGNVIPVNADAWKTNLDAVTEHDLQPRCEGVKAERKESRALLLALYPGLAHGAYSLQITLAPRGRTDRAAFAPIKIEV